MAVTKAFDLEFRKDGTIHDEGEAAKVLAGLEGLTDLIVLSHGWNNDKADAGALYEALLGSLQEVAGAGLVPELADRRVGALRLFWPSKKFADSELIPGGGAASATGPNEDALRRALDELTKDPDRLGGSDVDPARKREVERAKALIDQLETSVDARRDFVQAIRAILNPDDKHAEDASAEFFETAPETLFKNFTGPVTAPGGSGGGGATSMSSGGAAGFVGDMLDGVKAGARRIANFATYYQMKTRAGTVGRVGAGPMLARIRHQRPNLHLHLVGHSFGGRLVTAAAATLPPGSKAVSLTLLQAAYSHNGLSSKFDGANDGAFRTVLADRRVSGPVIITHTKNDKAVGVAYPLASRISRDVASALGDENDPYGGIGRNGAQHTPEAVNGSMKAIGATYAFVAGKVFNLKADAFISNHSDVTGPAVAYALARAIVTIDKD